MGACLSTQSKYQQSPQQTTLIQPVNIKAQIAKQLSQPSIINNLPQASSEATPALAAQRSASLLEKSGKTTEQDKASEAPASFSNNQRIQQKFQNKIGGARQGKISLDELAKVLAEHQSQPEQQSHDSSASQESVENEDEEDSEIETETPQNRLTKMRSNQLGNGLTEQDNKLIALSLNSEVPLRLPEVKLLNNSIYLGEWVQGKRQGQGVVQWEDGSVYSGQWFNNCSHGKGKLTFVNSGVYQGDFYENKAHGKGVFTGLDGSRYEGDWKDNEREGEGVLTWKDGERYEGNWVANKKQGLGQLYFRDGSFYRGQFNANEIHGHGFYSWYNSREYTGEWEHNQMSGYGKLKWANGQVYEGYFANSKYQGEGTLTLPSGCSSKGQWEKGRKQGIFQEKDAAGRIVHIEFHLGKKLRQPEQKKRREERTISSLTQSF